VVEITISVQDNKAVLTIDGELREDGAAKLKEELTGLLAKNLTEVEIDMRGVHYMGSSSIGKILLFYKNFAIKGGSLRIVNLADPLLELFTELKLNTLFSISGI
jgi:anti-sigma B factor antagonist